MLPGAFPNLLANGSSGIAVGMATIIPPHNAAELCDAALHLIKNPNARIETLVGLRPRPRLPDRRHHRRGAGEHPRGLPHRPRQLPRPRPLAGRGPGPRHLCRGGHRDPLSGAEGAADREDRRAARGQAPAAGRRRARRIGRGHPRRHRAEEPHRRRRADDGVALPADRPRGAHAAQHERPLARASCRG